MSSTVSNFITLNNKNKAADFILLSDVLLRSSSVSALFSLKASAMATPPPSPILLSNSEINGLSITIFFYSPFTA